MANTRLLRVAKQIQEDLAEIFRQNAGKFSGNMISVTHVEMSQDLSIAKVHVSIFPAENKKEILKDIKAETKMIRYELGKRVKNQLRKVPEPVFFLDDSLDKAERITNLLKD